MARHEHLPIYKAALDLTVHFEKLVAQHAGAQFLDLVAPLLTDVLHPLRLLWSRQIEELHDRVQSEAGVRMQPVKVSSLPGLANGEFELSAAKQSSNVKRQAYF